MKKLFLAMMAVATIALVGCKKDPEPTPTPTPTPTPSQDVPELDGVPGAILVAINIPDGICKDVYMEGNYEGYSIDVATATKFAPLAGFANWYTATVAIPEGTEDVTEYMGNCKILLSDEAGNIPSDWSSQWNSDKVTIAEGSPAELVDDMGQKAMHFTADAVGAVVYLTIEGWQNKPCAAYGVATAAKIKAANVTAVDGEGVEQNWQWADMEAKGNGVFTYTLTIDLANGDNFGCNIGYVDGEEIVESWYPYEGDAFADGDRVQYTFTSENGPKGTVVVEKVPEN